MKHQVSLFIFLFSLVSVSITITPITHFEEGDYVGGGSWLAQDSSTGNFSVFLDVEPDNWTIAKFEVANLNIYKTTVTIDDTGFLSAVMIDETDPIDPIYYPGYGSC